MKQIILILSLFGFTSMGWAHADLEAPMKLLGEQFKVIAGGIQSKNFTEKEYQAIEVMQEAIADASLIYPHTATDDQLKAQYSMWMAELMKMALTLETQAEVAMLQSPQNLTDATQTLMDMNELRKKAHDIFKED